MQMKESHFPGNLAMQNTATAKYLGVVRNEVLAIAVVRTQQLCVCVYKFILYMSGRVD